MSETPISPLRARMIEDMSVRKFGDAHGRRIGVGRGELEPEVEAGVGHAASLALPALPTLPRLSISTRLR